jgi:hypothetical protein
MIAKRRGNVALVLPPVLLLIAFWSTSFYGLDFGTHWDENAAKFDSVRGSVNTGVFLQASESLEGYTYGGVNYLLTWVGFTPELLQYLRKGPVTREGLSAVISPINHSLPIRLRVRAIYLVVSSLSILWLFLLAIVLGRSRVEAFLGAAILSGSWEFAYHSRWMAPDGVMAQFCLLSVLCLAVGHAWKKLGWFYLGSIAIGLTIGTKYPGGLILPFFLAGAGYSLWRESHSVLHVGTHTLGFIGTAGLTFVLTTPGAVLDPFRFFAHMRALRDYYAAGWFGYTVKPGIHHFYVIFRYFLVQVFSHYRAISIVFGTFGLVGSICLVWEAQMVGLLVVGFSLAYLAYFSQQAAMIVRNLLVVLPFLCLATARGITTLAERLSPAKRIVVWSFVGALLAVNLGWEIYTAQQIGRRLDSRYFLQAFTQYVQKSDKDVFFVSAKLASALHGNQAHLPENMLTDPKRPYTKVAFLQTEGPDVFWPTWPSDWFGMYETTFGALEVNLDAYPTFVGNQRILVVTAAHFKRLPINEAAMLTP